MEKEEEEKNQRVGKPPKPVSSLVEWSQWKRSRCKRKVVRDPHISYQSYVDRLRRNITSPARISEAAALQSENRKSASSQSQSHSPEKEERDYSTRGSGDENINGKASTDGGERGIGDDNRGGGGLVWPKLYITLSSKEKEEDFMAMKGCKPPHRPKKRAKIIQRTLLLVSPGAWLTDMCQERYEVREKKSCNKKRPRGLKAMGSMESDSE